MKIFSLLESCRRMLRRIHDKRAGMKKLEDSKKRWRRKIEGEDYVSSEEEEEPPTPPRALSPFVQQDPHAALVDCNSDLKYYLVMEGICRH